MELFYAIFGLVMLYTWIHGTIIVIKKIKKITSYERVVLISATTAFVLYVMGTIN